MHYNVDFYIEYVKSNPEKINKRRHLLIKNIVLPLIDQIKKGEVFFDKETYEKCIAYCEKNYHKFFPYQKFITAFIFVYETEAMEVPYFRKILALMGRGNGKDGMFGPITNFLTTHYYGIPNYDVEIVANAEDQAEDTFLVVYNMLEDNKKKMNPFFYWNKEQIINKQTKSRYRFNTSNAKTKDGKKPGVLLFNEYHSYEDYEQIKVFTSGLGKVRHPRIIIMSTRGYVQNGPLDDELDRCDLILNGEPNVLRIFPFICEIDDDEQAHDKDSWVLANPSLDFMPTLKTEIEAAYHEAQNNIQLWIEFMTKRMNRPMQDEEKTITSIENIMRASYESVEEDWKIKKIPRKTPNLVGKNAIAGIDYAQLNDFASAGFLFEENGEYIWRGRTWICKQSQHYPSIKFPFDNYGNPGYEDYVVVDEPFIRQELIVDWMVGQMVKYNTLKIITDSHRFGLLRQEFEKHGILVEDREHKNELVRKIRLPGSIYNIVIPQMNIEFISGNINIGDSAITRWAINNTFVKTTGNNLVYEKVEPKLRKNDPFMALVHAYSGKELLEEEVITLFM